ncbi:BON domain-containing protein [Massilia arenosa]|uniref:BON domain-containing protein n=1 Tax=Zemynaea arenosa TaxID=2561931 RepID=A0A4Y9SVF1_9BURK|nr:BON domain-containing protein [Massilia arenosa]TFW28726.1 BON domain-containing protein [Massilia arenosa]
MKASQYPRLLAVLALTAASFGVVYANEPAAKPAASAPSADDAALNAKVKAALADLKDVTVSSTQGEVVLAGSVASSGDADRALQLASAVEGVKKVKNELKVAGK